MHGEAAREVRVDRNVVREVVADRIRIVAGAGGEEAVGQLDASCEPTVAGDRMPAAAKRVRFATTLG